MEQKRIETYLEWVEKWPARFGQEKRNTGTKSVTKKDEKKIYIYTEEAAAKTLSPHPSNEL